VNNFYLCAYQTTQEFWQAVVKLRPGINLQENPSRFNGKTRPVEQVSWDDIQIFITNLNDILKEDLKKLSEHKKIKFKDDKTFPSGIFSLPSETQWEFAALANEKFEAQANKNFMYVRSDNLNDVGWYRNNSNEQTMPVGLKQPNDNGLYDMSGNVWEWCQNDYRNIETNGEAGPNQSDAYKTLRGGSYIYQAQYCRLRNRYNYRPGDRGNDGGFRLRFSPSSENEG